ncbi:MAG: hypothetical protein WBM00_02795 [Solirubrobacterales bacterium]
MIGGSSTRNTATVLEEQAERIERRLAKNPEDENLLLALTRTRLSVGRALVEVNPETGEETVTPEARAAYEEGLADWKRYRKRAGSEPSVSLAQLVAGTSFRLAEASFVGIYDIETHIAEAARAQRIVASQRPSVGSLTTLAIYEYFDADFNGGDQATKEAEAKAPSKAEAKNIETQLADYRKRAKKLQKELRRYAKLESERSKQALSSNPFSNLAPTP